MVYYIKQGQSSILRKIKLYENECEIAGTISKMKENKKEKIVKSIKKSKIEDVVLSNEIKRDEEFVRQLNNYDITILDGKWLMQFLLEDIIKYLRQKNKIYSELDEITLLINDLTDDIIENVKTFAKIYKKIRIVTNHLEKFKRIEKQLYEESGITIIISNNKRKALVKSMMIINFDFKEETINEYNIKEDATIINLNDKIKINTKRFSGLIITDYEVELEKNKGDYQSDILNTQEILNKEKEFALKEILEEKIYSQTLDSLSINKFRLVKTILKEHDIKIKELYGLNGIV